MMAVPVMHENVHQWAGKEEEVGENAKDVRLVLLPE